MARLVSREVLEILNEVERDQPDPVYFTDEGDLTPRGLELFHKIRQIIVLYGSLDDWS